MGMLAWIFGIIAGLCALTGILTAVEGIPQIPALNWMFWFALSGILLLATIAFAVGGRGYE